jgi:glutaredoxin/uncharacterized damage-inducible protein DinB
MCTIPSLRVYWQPGCTSCLRTKEFLTSRGVVFESINVLEAPLAMAELQRLGARSVPVVARGDAFILAQDLAEVAAFVGVSLDHRRLPADELLARLDDLLTFAARCAASLPREHLGDEIPGRARSYADIAYHVAMIARGFIDAVAGAELSYAHFERRPDAALMDPLRLAQAIDGERLALAACAASTADPDRPLRTYYGLRPLHEVLERTAWHVAQHCRQLEFIARHLGVRPEAQLTAELLAGLPLPRDVWDAEIKFA